MSGSNKDKEKFSSPLFVDLDGTFIKSDMLFESFILAVKNNPWVVFLSFLWLFKGRSYFKYKLSQNADIDVALLPLNTDFYSFLLGEKNNNREIILATASSEKYAEKIIQSYKLFDSFICSDRDLNLKGNAKLEKIQSISDEFSYAGNSSVDFKIFKYADEKYLVNPTVKARKMSSSMSFDSIFDDQSFSLKKWLKQLRVYQWVKNILIFVPLLVSGMYIYPESIFLSISGFLSFSLLASATYIVNDLLDLEADRIHLRKRRRPLASGQISIVNAIIISSVLCLISLGIAINIGQYFSLVLIMYLILTLTYSLKIKSYVGADVITLASLYTIRIIAGSAILNVMVSFWLLSFSMFIFFSLALVKRCAELKSLEREGDKRTQGRDYGVEDYNIVMSFGVSSALMAVLMFCFYTNSNILSNQYNEPTVLWLIVPALSYWLLRMWIKTNRGEMDDDPITFSLKDKGSVSVIAFIIFITLMAQIL